MVAAAPCHGRHCTCCTAHAPAEIELPARGVLPPTLPGHMATLAAHSTADAEAHAAAVPLASARCALLRPCCRRCRSGAQSLSLRSQVQRLQSIGVEACCTPQCGHRIDLCGGCRPSCSETRAALAAMDAAAHATTADWSEPRKSAAHAFGGAVADQCKLLPHTPPQGRPLATTSCCVCHCGRCDDFSRILPRMPRQQPWVDRRPCRLDHLATKGDRGC